MKNSSFSARVRPPKIRTTTPETSGMIGKLPDEGETDGERDHRRRHEHGGGAEDAGRGFGESRGESAEREFARKKISSGPISRRA